jgi:predicted nuclease with RNAse H fold
MSDEPVYIGIDPTADARNATLAVLDRDLRVVMVSEAAVAEVLERVGAYPQAMCAVDAPIGPNRRLMAEPNYRQRLGLRPSAARYARFRVCEYELRRRGIRLYSTPPEVDKAPAWMRSGWALYDSLRGIGYVEHPRPGERQMCEVHPHACYTALIGRRPYNKARLEGRLQRQLVLYDEGLDVADPMRLLEEWTRHHLRRGTLKVDSLYSHDSLDALVAAYTAFLLANEPHRITVVGDPSEGQIVVPAETLLDRYP